MLLPYAALPGPVFPGFLLLNQTALLLAYGLGAWLLYVQFHRERTLSLLLAASASLFTAALIAAQTASFPGVFGPGTVRLIGHDAGTSSWFWVFWHAGPVLLGLSYAATVRRDRDADFRPGRTLLAAWLSVAGTLLLAVAFSAASVAWLRWLPPGSRGDDYSVLVTSGIGPGLVLFTVAALAAVWRATRAGRTVLELWIAVSLVLLTLDAILTQAGLTRGSVGCYAGRIGALFSAVAVLWAYLHEVKAAYPRAEKAAVAEVLRFEASLRQSQKMEAIGHLTSGIAHDFNNLLTVMTSAFTLIQRRPNDPAQVQQMAEAGLKAVARGSSLASQLLSFSRHKVPHLTVVNLNAVLIDFEAIAVRAIPISMDLEWHLAPELPEVKLDTADFETAVLNLVVNARDVMAAAGHTTEDTAEGRIVVATRAAVLDVGTLPEGARTEDPPLPPAGYVVVSVSDDGPGMPSEVALRAFSPFFTTKEAGKGTGLGLSQVYQFARLANGLAVIRPGMPGTTVELWLPQAVSVDAETPAGCHSFAAAKACFGTPVRNP